MTVAPTAPAKTSQIYTGHALEYITFFCYNKMGEAYAENEEIEEIHYFQFDLWQKPNSKKNIDAIENQVEVALKPLGFMGFSAQELYEPDTKMNHIAIRCNVVLTTK